MKHNYKIKKSFMIIKAREGGIAPPSGEEDIWEEDIIQFPKIELLKSLIR